MQQIRHLFWDNDGIFVETEQLYFESTRRILAEVGVDLTLAMYRELLLDQARGAWFMAEARGYDAAAIEEMVQRRNDLYGQLILEQTSFLPHVVSVVESLAPHYAMGIVTSSRKVHFELIHRSGQITKHMDFILWGGMYAKSKPAPDPYLKALELSGADPSEVLVIEDSLRGLRSAHAAGLRCWVIPSPMTASQDFSLADKVLDSIQDLPNFLSNCK